MAYDPRMSLVQSKPRPLSARKLKKLIIQSVKESSAIEGIHHPFAKGKRTYWPDTMEDLVRYWTKRVAAAKKRAAAARSRRRKASRAARSRGSSPRE
jgi:hypothetical protein